MAGSSDLSDSYDVGDKSKINIAYVYLLFNIQMPLEKINNAHMDSNFFEWRKLLDRLFINSRMSYTDKEKEQQKNEVAKVNLAFENIKSPVDCINQEPSLRAALGNYEIFLRELCYKHDMLLPKKDSRWIM